MGNDYFKSDRHKYYWILVLLVVNQVTSVTASEWLCFPKNISVPIGSNVTLCCQTVSNSSTVWVKKNVAILIGNQEMGWNADQRKRYKILGMGKFMITNVTESDDSVYACSYSNGNKVMYLTVQLSPDPPKVSSDKNVYKSGENATLTCTSSGKPAPTIYWISQGRRYIGVSAINDRTTTNTLSILVSRQYNKQSFTCFVYNDVNINKPLQQNMIFDVQYPPHVRIKQRINQDLFKVIENTRMTLTCIVDANPPISNIKWIKDSKLLKDSPYVSSEKEFHYSENVSKADNGKYECSAENSLGTKNDFIHVDILYYPRISVKSNITVAQKSSVILNCSADANPPATIKWIGKNNQIRNKNNFIIHNVRVGDAGKYRCEAQNNMLSSMDINRTGTAIAITTLHVKYKPGPAILRLAGTPIKGEDIVLICDLPHNAIGYPHPYFRWRKIGNNYFKESTKKLVIANATLSDSGSYTCNAQNIEGEGSTDSLEVRVKEYPEFQKKLNRFLYLNVTDKSPILMCKVRGNPSPNITWYKDGHPVSRYDYIVGQSKPQPQQNSFVVTSFLNFSNFSSNSRNVRPSDTGNYSCVVTTLLNQSFVLKSNIQIIIKSSPQIKKKDEIVAIDLNDNASISIIVQVYPPPKFHWSKNNMPLPFRNTVRELGINKYQSTFIIPSATRADLGVYKCYVNNTYGFQVITRDIRETSVPDAPGHLSSVDATWESVYLSWVAGFNGGEEQTFVVSYINSTHNHSVEVAVENTGKIYYNVTNLMPDTTYVFSVQGRNRLGKSKSSNSFSVHTIYLALPTPENVKYLVAEKKIQFDVRTDYECCTRLLIAKNGENLNNLVCMPAIKKWKNNSVDLPNADVESVSVGLCLKRRRDLCGNYVQAVKVEPNMSAGPLSTFHVIVIAVVCGIILIVLVVILILFLYWRSRNQKKQYGNEVNYPHMSNGSVPNGIAGRQGYDNPDGPYTNGFVENTHNTSSEHTDELPPYTDQDIGQELSDESDLDKPYDCRPINDSVINELPPSYSDVCRGPPEKPGAMTFYNNPHNITRNPNFISLSPDGMPRDTSISGRESGYSTPDSTRPKKWHKRNDNSEQTYYSQIHQTPHDASGHSCAMPCCTDDLRLESPKRSSCLPLFGLSRSTDRYQDHRRLLWNRPLLSTKNFSFPRLGTRHVERKTVIANSDKTVDKDLELVACRIKPPKTKGKCQTLHFDFSQNESQDEEAEDEERNKSSETLLEDMPDLTQQESSTFRRSRSTFMPIPLIAETQFNTNSLESETKLFSELPPITCSTPQYRTSPLARRSSGKTITMMPSSYETKPPLSSLYSTPSCIYQTNTSIYSSKYTSQVEPYYATVQKPRTSVVSPVSSLQSSATQFGSNSSMTSFTSPLVQRKSQPNLTSSTLSYSTTATTSMSTPGNKTYESIYKSNPPTLTMYSVTTTCEVTTAQDTETKYADVTSLMTSKNPVTSNNTMPIRTQFNRLASQVASKKISKGILKNQKSGSQCSIETQSSTTHFPVYESIDDLKYIDDTSSESSFLMEQKINRQDSGRRRKLANPTQNNNNTHNNKNAVSLVL